MSTTRSPQYKTPNVTIAEFQGEPMIELVSGRRSVLIRPEDAVAVTMAVGMGLKFLGKLPNQNGGSND